MARKTYRYSLNRRDAKLVGVCSTIAERFGINPWLVRLGFVADLLVLQDFVPNDGDGWAWAVTAGSVPAQGRCGRRAS